MASSTEIDRKVVAISSAFSMIVKVCFMLLLTINNNKKERTKTES